MQAEAKTQPLSEEFDVAFIFVWFGWKQKQKMP